MPAADRFGKSMADDQLLAPRQSSMCRSFAVSIAELTTGNARWTARRAVADPEGESEWFRHESSDHETDSRGVNAISAGWGRAHGQTASAISIANYCQLVRPTNRRHHHTEGVSVAARVALQLAGPFS